MSVTATYNGEEVDVVFIAETERNDYGVPGSPVWYEVNPDSIKIDALSILGLDVDIAALPKDLQDAIYALADEVEFA